MSNAIPNIQVPGLIGGLAGMDPISQLIDVGAGILGLPPEVKNIAKIAAGIATSNPFAVISGVTGLVQNMNEVAATEWKPPPSDSPLASSGYAASSGSSASSSVIDSSSGQWSKPRPPGSDVGTPPTGGGTGSGGPLGNGPRRPVVSEDDRAYYDACRIIERDFDKFETAGHWRIRDGELSLMDLQAAAVDPNAPEHIKAAAAYFVDNPRRFMQLVFERGGRDVMSGMPYLGREGLAAEVREGQRRGAFLPVGDPSPAGGPFGPVGSGSSGGTSGSGPTTSSGGNGSGPVSGTGGTSGSGGADRMDDIMNNPNLSASEKAELVLEQILSGLDDEMTDILGKMRKVRKDQAGIKDGEGSKEKAADLASDLELLQHRLQKVMERRTQMFTLLTNMSKLNHEASMAAINNNR